MAEPGRYVTVGQSVTSSSLGGSSVDLHSQGSPTSRAIDNYHEGEEVNNSSNPSSATKKRGRTRNVALAKSKSTNEKLKIDIADDFNRFVGANSQQAITESGCLARRCAPLKVTKWAKIDEDKKLDLLRDFKGSFNVEDSVRCDRVVFSQMNSQYRNYRHKLYKKYFLQGITPEHVDADDWEYLCTYFASDEFQRISKRNTKNRAVQDARHIAGTRSFARICRETEEKKGDVVGSIELYKLTHCKSEDGSDEGAWVSDIAKENYRKMLECQKERQSRGENPVDEEKICEEILRCKSNFSRDEGAGSMAVISLPNHSYQEELDEAKRNARIAQERAEKAEQQVLAFSEQLEDQKTIIDELKEGLAATQKAMVEYQNSTAEMMSYFQQLRRTGQIPATLSSPGPGPRPDTSHARGGARRRRI